MTTTKNTLKAILTVAALEDLRLAKAKGRMAVTGTKLGNLEISHSDGVYTITGDNGGRHHMTGTRNEARDFMMGAYVVVE